MLPSVSRSLTAAVLAASLLAVAGCGGDEEAAPATSATPSAPTSAPASASPSASTSPTPKVKVSTSLEPVTVKGGYGKEPKVKIETPFTIDKTRTKVLSEGEGAEVKAGQTVEVNYYGVNGRTGKKFDDSFSRGASIAFPLDQVVPGFSKGLVGQRQGSRVVMAMPGSDGYDASGGSQQGGIKVGDTLVFVVDLVGVQLTGPEGTEVTPKPGLPTVTDAEGRPKITVPKTPAPTTLQVQPLIKGDGRKVTAADTLTFNYEWVAWRDGRVLESSYGSQPANLPVSGLLAGMRTGLVGQTVGSRVLLVIPPAQGYPNGNATPKVDQGETLVMVVDLLFAAKTQ